MSDVPKIRITVKLCRAVRTTSWTVTCSRCVDLRALCHKKATAEAFAVSHSRESHQQKALIAITMR